MDGKLFYKYAKICNDNRITIYPKPSNSGKYKIIINTRGVEKIGTEIYENEPTIKLVEIKTTTGVQKIKEQVPSVWDKISELYVQIVDRYNLKPIAYETAAPQTR